MKTTNIRTVLSLIPLLLLTPAAHAFYNPSTGRWLNRDPIASQSRAVETHVDNYVFAKNTPVQRYDVLGLLTDEEKKAACREAWKEDQARAPGDRIFTGTLGEAICVGKEAVGCAWEEKTKGWAPEMIACEQAHEDSHAKDVNTLKPPAGCPAEARCGIHTTRDPTCKNCSKYYSPQIGSKDFARQSECTAYKALYECMKAYASKVPRPKGFEDLEKRLRAYVEANVEGKPQCPEQFPDGKVTWPK
jgi:hypothetical protein